MKQIQKTFEYYRIKNISSEFSVEFDSLKEFAKYAEKTGIKNIFLLPAENELPERFAFIANGGICINNNCGFVTVEDFNNSIANNFPDAANFYSGRELGFDKYDEYKMSTETGITDASAYDLLKKDGYIDGFKQYESMQNQFSEGYFPTEITNAFELEKYKSNLKFETIQELINACCGGFQEPSEYRESITKGYKNYTDFKAGSVAGFSYGKDYYTAKEKGIENITEYTIYINFQTINLPGQSHDENLLLTIISKITDGKKTSTNKIFEVLQTEKETYRREDKVMPTWFKSTINTLPELVDFIKQNENVKKYGSYDDDGEYFQKKKLNDRTVILDGANVSYGIAGGKDTKPLLKNILIMLKFLIEKGFTDITCFTDASLKHRFTDKEHLDEIQRLCSFQYTPADRPADIFLITHVKQNHCLIVTNDKFRDWKVIDPWVAQNIDYYTLAYMIKDEKVNMPEFQD